MQFRFPRRPSPATAVAFVALVAALTGSAVALPGKNGVDSGDIRKNAVRSSDIKNGAVNGKDVKNNGVTGTDVRESSLGTVPRAAAADAAVNAENAANAAGLAGFRAVDLGNTVLADGGTKELLRHGPFTYTATCEINDGGTDTASLDVTTSEDNAVGYDYDTGGEFNIADGAHSFLFRAAVTGESAAESGYYSANYAASGAIVLARTDALIGVNLFGQPGCHFRGFLYVK